MSDQFDYFQWRRTSQTFPCLFARALPHSLPHESVALRDIDEVAPEAIANDIDRIVDAAIRSPSNLVVAICIPAWTLELMAMTFAELSRKARWSMCVHPNLVVSSIELVPVGLHRELQEARDDKLAIETVPMALGPFGCFPPSRQCPTPILEMTVDPGAVGKKAVGGKLRSDVLRLPSPWLDEHGRAAVKRTVRKNTELANNGKDPRAIADNTATFPLDYAKVLHD